MTQEIKTGDFVEYTGRGFIGFDESCKQMKVLAVERFNAWVKYKNIKLLVRLSEIKPIEPQDR